MSQQADQIRDKRRAFALPGGSLDRTIRILAIALPALIGAIAATMLIAPLSPRGEVSFILDRNKVDTARDRLRVDNAMYRGRDEQGRPFSLTAGEAVQRSASVPVVRLSELTARLIRVRLDERQRQHRADVAARALGELVDVVRVVAHHGALRESPLGHQMGFLPT